MEWNLHTRERLDEMLWDFVNSYDTCNDSELILSDGINNLIDRIKKLFENN